MNPAILAAVIASLAAAGFLAWALMERARANRAELRAFEAAQAGADPGQLAFLKSQATEQANAVAKALLERTDETFRAREQMAQQRLEAQLKPVAETLAKFEAQVTAAEKARADETGGLKEQIAGLMRATSATQDETRKLSATLRRGAGVQGRWGEQTLRNVLEAAGLQNRFDFEEQVSLDTDEGRRRPDVKVRLPGGGVFVIDAKCSLNAFLDAQEAADDQMRESALARHAASVRAHMGSLSNKAYWDQFKDESSPSFVVMFVPGDGFLVAAQERLPDLMTEAMDKNIVLTTPSTLFALCKAVSYGWRLEDQAKGAAKIAELGKELYKRLSVMGGHTAAMGRALEQAVARYNEFVGSLETKVMTQARRFEELQVDHEGKELPELEQIDIAPRQLTKLDDETGSPPRLKAARS